jgi:hypothetical protein
MRVLRDVGDVVVPAHINAGLGGDALVKDLLGARL